MRILIVDDEGSLLVTLVANLELEGFDVVGVQDAATALQLIREQRFDLVLTDIRMPGMSGVDLFRAIKSLRAGMPVLLMTAFAAETLIDEAIQEGVFTVLPKPFDIEHVIFALSRAASHPMVLLVDEAAEATPTVEALRAVGLASCVTSGQEATVLAIQERRADVALVNVALVGGGPALVERILGLDASIAVIAISGGSAPELFRRVAELGAFACLVKPLEPARVVQLVARARGRPRPPLRPAITNGGRNGFFSG
jgi:DNA-binding NtrC family response regulator